MPRKARPKHQGRRPTYIRAWRKHRGLTLIQLAERLLLESEVELSDGQLSRIERGEQPYSQDLLEAFARALTCTPADLLMRDPSDGTPGGGIWSIWDTLEPSEKAQAVEVIKALKRTGTGG